MQIYSPSSSFTRPADTTAYAAGDLVANNTTAGSVSPLSWTMQSTIIGGPLTLKRVRISKTTTTVTAFTMRLHLYTASPTVANGDNGAFSSTQAATYIGYITVDGSTTPGAKFSDGAVGIGAVPAESEMNIRIPTGRTIYGLLEATAAYAPGNAEVITVTLDLVEHYARGA